MEQKATSLIGVVHVPALPGAADYGSMQDIIQRSLKDAESYLKGGADALLLENMHDVPYLRGYVESETVAAMSAVAYAVRQKFRVETGVQLLAAANLEALAVAVAADLDFIRVEGFVFAHVGDEGLHQASAPALIRKRAALSAKKIKIYADIKKKHSSHAITHDLSLTETAHAAEFFQADGVIITGLRTGSAPPVEAVQEAAAAVKIPVLIGSGVTPQNMSLYGIADAVIVGSYAKYNGNWREAVDPERVKELAFAIKAGLK